MAFHTEARVLVGEVYGALSDAAVLVSVFYFVQMTRLKDGKIQVPSHFDLE